MARTAKRLGAGFADSNGTTAYTVPASTTTTIVSIIIANTGSADDAVTISLGGNKIVGDHVVVANDTMILELKNAPVIINASEDIYITGGSTGVYYYITGVEEV